jgi:CRISPR-associated protein Csx10
MTQQICLLTVRLRSPLLIGDESGLGNYEQTADCIPGTVLRGAIGERLLEASCTHPDHIRNHAGCPGRESCAFWRVFGAENPPHFGNAYLAPRGWGFPFPATARTCKYHPGYYDFETNPDGHGVFDTLVKQFVYDLVSDPCFPRRAELLPELSDGWANLLAHYDPKCSHPDCQGPVEGSVEPATGYYLLDGATPGYTPHPTVSRATHVGISRARGVAEDALLFTLETIEARPNIEFRARLTYNDAYATDLGTVLDLSGQAHTFYIGRGRSRGLGRVKISVDLAPSPLVMGDRMKDLNRQVNRALEPYHAEDERVPESFPGHFFSLTLRAAAILAAPDGTPALWPNLAAYDLADAWPLRAWARTTLVGGWDTAAGLPRPTRQAVEPGAVYLFYLPSDKMDWQTLVDRLEALELAGLGVERGRGYGQVTVCAPFHYAGWRQ